LIGFVWRGLRLARGRAAALAAGMLVAATAFALLTASVDVNSARISGVVGRNWRGAYDLLVLPAGSPVARAGRNRLVQVNYLSATTGGITMAQYSRVEHLAGVGVAAPLAVVGYVLETTIVPITLSPAATGQTGARVLTLSSTFTADRGLSTYPAQQQGYVYITPDALSPLEVERSTGVVQNLEQLPDGQTIGVCASGGSPAPPSSPFQQVAESGLDACYSRVGPGSPAVQGYVQWSFPVLVAGIDPTAESRLTGLNRAVTSGGYLREGEGDKTVGTNSVVVPVLASTQAFDGDVDQVTVTELPSSAVDAVRSGEPAVEVMQSIDGDRGTVVQRATVTGAQAWQQLLHQLSAPITAARSSYAEIVGQYWTASGVHYVRRSEQLYPQPTANPDSIWQAGINVNGLAYVPAPPAAADIGFRTLTEHTVTAGHGAAGSRVFLGEIGAFDPARLPGFSGAGPGSPLASYRAPLLSGATAASARALGGQPLEPDGNMAGYAQPPPMVYTTLAGAAALENPNSYAGTGQQAAAPISSIRVRVAGLRGTVSQQLTKIAAVAQEITTATGLQVIVTSGASPEPVTVTLPSGRFGRPQLKLTEDWTAVGVSLVVLRQADRESLALFALILVVCALFLAGAALAGVRSRRAEIGGLRSMGWGRRQVFVFILGEVVLLGVLAGAAGAALSALLIEILGLSAPLWRAALVLPIAAALAAVSAIVPALLAARIQPLHALTSAARTPRSTGRRTRTVFGLALTEVARRPGRCALAAADLAVGVVGLTVLLAAHASFATSIGDSELAGLVTSSVRGTDLAAVLLTVGLSAVAVADLTYLNLRERAGELAALSASGWGRLQLARLLTTEAVITALSGAAVGAAGGLAIAATAFGVSLTVVAAAVIAAAGGTAVALAATALVLMFTAGQPLTAVLAMDE
jgi:putative ABC transport system permease protein